MTHGHMQMLLAADNHYPTVERFNQLRRDYEQRFGSDYFEEWFNVHRMLGLGVTARSVRVFAHVAPVREREVILIGPGRGKDVETVLTDLGKVLFAVLSSFRDDMKVNAFNVAVYFPPFGNLPEWEGFPFVVRVIDRGSAFSKPSDVGSLELFAAVSVIAADPFDVFRVLRPRIEASASSDTRCD